MKLRVKKTAVAESDRSDWTFTHKGYTTVRDESYRNWRSDAALSPGRRNKEDDDGGLDDCDYDYNYDCARYLGGN